MKTETRLLLLLILGTVSFCKTTLEDVALPAICALKCPKDRECEKNCNERREKIQRLDEEAEANATLVCRDVKFIVLAHSPGIFVIERRSNEKSGWSNAVKSNGSKVTLHYLSDGTKYQFRLHKVSEHGLSRPEITGWFDTMTDDHEPSKVSNISILRLEVDPDDPMHMRSVIGFTPAEDRSCFYEVTCSDSGNRNILHEPQKPVEFNVTFESLEFRRKYTVRIKARTRRGIEGDKAVMVFTTPSCLDKHSNLTICVPDEVENLNATTTRKGGRIFDVNVTWNMPELIPDLYHVWMYPNISDYELVIVQNASGTSTESVFSDVEIADQFQVHIRAQSTPGLGPTISKNFKLPMPSPIALPETPIIRDVGTIIMTFLASVVLLVGTGVYAYHRHGKRMRNQMRLEYFRQDLEEKGTALETIKEIEDPEPIAADKSLLTPLDEYEICPDRLEIKRVLGSGAFGIVKLGNLRDNRGQVAAVAVKMLRDDPNEEDLRCFELEIKMMKSVGQHPNIVCLLGCCTIGPRPLLIVEYCSRGDLQSFLRAILEKATVSINETKKRCESSPRSHEQNETLRDNFDGSFSSSASSNDDVQISSFVANRAYDIDRVAFDDTDMVTVTDLLNFGRQIATGMEFLSSNRVVHRDLAARNVLVCDDKTVKISDFGLSRDVYQENVYKKQGSGRLPVKWMAIEALTHQVYSTFSDVWSFGILLWEIVTLGSSPYPDIPANGVLQRLRSGYRMERPANCSVSLYNVMLSCWQTKPKDRPTFTVLRQELDKLLGVAADTEYLDLNDVSKETWLEDEDPEISSSRYTYIPLHPRYVKDNELHVIREA